MARTHSAEGSATTRTSARRTTKTSTKTSTRSTRPPTRRTSTVPPSAQASIQPEQTSTRCRTNTTKHSQNSVGSEDSHQTLPSPISTSAQQPSLIRHTHTAKRLQSSIAPERNQQKSRPIIYQSGQVQQQPKPHTRSAKPLQPSSSRPPNINSQISLPPHQRPAKHATPSGQPRSTKRLRLSPPPIPHTLPPPQPEVRLLIHTSAPTNPSQDALYRKQAAAVLRGFDAATHISLSPTSFDLPSYEDGESIPDRQVDPRDAWMSMTGDDLGTYDEDLEAMFRRYDKPRVEVTRKPKKKPREMKEDVVAVESLPEVLPQLEDDGQQFAQRREGLQGPSSAQYSALGFLLPAVESWEAPGESIPESQAQDGNTVEVPSSPILLPNRENVDVGGGGAGRHIPSSQPEESATNVAAAHVPHPSSLEYPEILPGDLTSPEFLTPESVKGERRMQKGKGKAREKEFLEQEGLSSPAYQVLRESALNTPAPQGHESSPQILSTPLQLQGNNNKRKRGVISQAQAQAISSSPARQILQEATPTPRALSTRSQTAKKFSLDVQTPVRSSARIEKAKKAKGSNAKGKSKSQVILNTPALQLSQLKSASVPTSVSHSVPTAGRYSTRSYSRQKQIEATSRTSTPKQPAPPPLSSPVQPQPPQKLPSRREFFYTPLAPAPHLLPSLFQSPPPNSYSHPSTASSLHLTNLPAFSPPLHPPNPPPLSTLVPPPHAILPPDLCPNEVNTNPPQVTSYLARLEEKPHTWVPYFKPVVRKRELRQWERGCWIVELSSPSPAPDCARWEGGKEKVQFWEKLRGNVVGGRLGMVGVFLGSEDAEGAEESDTIKFYCWGKVAELVWAFLFVISDRRTKVGLRWVDAAGEVVIQC